MLKLALWYCLPELGSRGSISAICCTQPGKGLRGKPLLRAPHPFLPPVFPGSSLRVSIETCDLCCLSHPLHRPQRASFPPALVVQDVADFEWVMWFTNFRNIIVFALSGHVLFGKLCTMVAPQVSRPGTLDLLLPAFLSPPKAVGG